MYCVFCCKSFQLFTGDSIMSVDGLYFHPQCYADYKFFEEHQMPQPRVEVNGQYLATLIRYTQNYVVFQVMRADKPFVVYIPRLNFYHGIVSIGSKATLIFRPGIDKTREDMQKELDDLKRRVTQLQNELELRNFPEE